MLETLHEDLNSVVDKPYVQYEENSKSGRKKKDEQIADEYWAGFKKGSSRYSSTYFMAS